MHDDFTELYNMLPKAVLFTTVALPNSLPPSLRGQKVHTSWMQHLPGMSKFYRLYFPLYPMGVRSLDVSDYELVISSSSGYGKGVGA